jgi:cell division protein DivIC
MKKNVKRVLVFGLFSVAIISFVSYSVFNIVSEIIDKYKEAALLEQKMVALEEKEEDLNNEILKLQDKEYLARYAREKYFYSKNGELIIRMPESEE